MAAIRAPHSCMPVRQDAIAGAGLRLSHQPLLQRVEQRPVACEQAARCFVALLQLPGHALVCNLLCCQGHLQSMNLATMQGAGATKMPLGDRPARKAAMRHNAWHQHSASAVTAAGWQAPSLVQVGT